ncbi:MAG: hypothetical protein R3315_02605 [Woeseiaceae bacterium]|nr:hypothetical protein [Woeseiaceae bacterium]
MKNKKFLLAPAIAAVLTSLAASPVLACGESLFRVGKGLTYREYTAPLPGNIVVVANTESELAMAEALAAAGHHVHVVPDAGQISKALAEHEADLVLSYFDSESIVSQQIAGSGTSFLPVTRDDSGIDARARYTYVLASEDSLKTFLKTIHRSLRERQS